MELGKVQTLTVLRKRENGIYLGTEEESGGVLLPRAEVPKDIRIGDTLEVFLYLDSSDRPIATVKIPPVQVGTVAMLRVAQANQIGAFLDWGLMKDLFLPFKEQKGEVREGMKVPVMLYIDRSGRLAATMRVSRHLAVDGTFEKNQKTEGLIYEINPELGAFVAVEGRYAGMIPTQEIYGDYRVGDAVKVRVLKVRSDGKLDLSAREKSYKQMEDDAALLLQTIESYAGVLPFSDSASPEVIKHELGLSKAAFKRAVGKLYKAGRIDIGETSIRLRH